jgi:phosphatidylglycerol---prolipoprotein diacylglyceryl transferase
MYPRLSDIFYDLFGFNFPIPIYSFGAMVAIAVLTASYLMARELNRMYAEGRVEGVRLPKEGKDGKKRGTRIGSPAELIGTLTVIAVVLGVVGAKVFHILENPGQFALDPFGMLFSTGGLTFYGGFIVAAAGIFWYVHKQGVKKAAVADAAAPGLMLAYGIGRIGCHLAGDGDWGIASDLALKPDWLPMWLWAETYPNNILGMYLPEPGVYPTPIYEFVMASALFGVLWALRKHPRLNGWLFSLYLVFSGAERLLIEQIRVNVEMNVFGLVMTQAEMISVILIIMGSIGLYLTRGRRSDEVADNRRPRVPASDAAS